MMPYITSPHPEAIDKVTAQLSSSDEKVINLAKEIASFAYNEERKKTLKPNEATDREPGKFLLPVKS